MLGAQDVFHPRLQVNAVRPDIHVAPGREIARLPAVIVGLPFRSQPGNHRRRQVRRLNGEKQLPKVIEGIRFIDGIEVIKTPSQNAA